MNTQLITQDIVRNAVLYLEQQKVYGNELFLEKPIRDEATDYHQWKNLNQLEEAVQYCTQCRLVHYGTGKNIGTGNRKASVMVISDTPEIIENGSSQVKLLAKILAAIKFTPEEVYTCSILKCSPPDKRKPLYDEISCCMPFLLGQIEIIAPSIILLLGKNTANALLGNEKAIKELRKENSFKFKNSYMYVTYHLAELLNDDDPYQKQKKKMVWEDVQSLRRKYDEIVGDKPKWQ